MYENLDPQDKAICEALEKGVSVEQICSDYNVEASKVESLKSVVLERVGSETSAETSDAPVKVPNEIAEEAGGAGFDAEEGFQG